MEKIFIALEEAKVKRTWITMNDDSAEDEEPPTEEERKADEEVESEHRRVYNYDRKSFNFANQRITDTAFSRRTYFPFKTKPRIEAEESMRRKRVMEEAKE